MNGNITKEGIKLDLEWMHRIGIGGFQNFDASLFAAGGGQASGLHDAGVEGRLLYATTLADQLGLEEAIAGSPGWSETGGPWVTPAQAMKKLVWSETRVEGGRPFTGALAKPPTTTGPFQNVPLTDIIGDDDRPAARRRRRSSTRLRRHRLSGARRRLPMRDLHPTVSSSAGKSTRRCSTTAIWSSSPLPMAPVGQHAWIQFAFPKPVAIRGCRSRLPGSNGPSGPPPPGPDLEASDDGRTFRKIANIPRSTAEQNTIPFPPVEARFFRVAFLTPPPHLHSTSTSASAATDRTRSRSPCCTPVRA